MSELPPIQLNIEAENPAKAEYDAGIKFLENNDLAQAANAFHNALLEYKQLNDDRGVANASVKLAEICIEKEDFARAFPHLDRAEKICEKKSDHLSQNVLRKLYGQAHTGSGEYDKAIDVYLDMLDAYQDYNNPQGAVETFEKMADVYLKAGNRQKAADSLRTAGSIHKNFKHKRMAQELFDRADAIEQGID
jgi:tetratricopeptide (TPR) repeat protein